MLAFDLEFGPNTSEVHKKLIYGIFSPRQLLSTYRAAQREHGTADLVLVCPNRDPDEVFAGPRADMSTHLRKNLKFPAPLVSAQSLVKLPKDHEAFWLIVQMGGEIPLMVVMYALAYEQAPEGTQLIGES